MISQYRSAVQDGCNLQLHILEDALGLRIDLAQKGLGLFVHNRMEFLHSAIGIILVKNATVLSPHGTVRHQAKAPGEVHSSSNSKAKATAY